jgi:hypothetical protein
LVKTEPILRLGSLAGSRMSASEILAPRAVVVQRYPGGRALNALAASNPAQPRTGGSAGADDGNVGVAVAAGAASREPNRLATIPVRMASRTHVGVGWSGGLP